MSKMMLRSSGKPPLARSPIRLRTRKPLQPALSNVLHSPAPGGSLMKSQNPNPIWAIEISNLRPEYETISCELKALAQMVHQELGTNNTYPFEGILFGAPKSPLFERGRFYDEYAARRNERLRRKKGEMEGRKPGYDLGVRVESAKKRETSKLSSRRKSCMSITTTPMAGRREAPTPRYSLRSSARKENNKSPLVPIMMSIERSERKLGVGNRQR